MLTPARRNLFTVFIIFLSFALIASIIYLNNFYLPLRIKSGLTQGLEQYLGCSVEIEKIKFNPIKGIVIENILISGGPQGRREAFFSLRQAYFNVLYLPLIFQRKLIIPVLHIDSPRLIVRYEPDKKFNIGHLRSSSGASAKKHAPAFDILIYKVNLFGGRCDFEDQSIEPAFKKSAQDINIGVSLELPAKISFLTQAKIPVSDGKFTRISAQGTYELLTNKLGSSIFVSGVTLKDFHPYLTKTMPLLFEAGTLEDASFSLNWDAKSLAVKGTAGFKGLELKKETLTLKGDVTIVPECLYVPAERSLSYKGTMRLSGCAISGIPGYPEKIENISGEAVIAQDKIETGGLAFDTLGSSATLSGVLEGFTRPLLQIRVVSPNLNLEKISGAFLAGTPVKVNGTAKADIKIKGEAAELPKGIEASLELLQARAEIPILKKPLEGITGQITLTSGKAAWQNLAFNYQGIAYTSSGDLANFKEPEVRGRLASKDLNLATELKLKDRILKIGAFDASYANSELNAKGAVDLRDTAMPSAQLTVSSRLRITDILPYLPQETAEHIRKNKIDATLILKGTAGGNPADYKNMKMDLNARSSDFTVRNLKFDSLSFDLTQKNGLLDISRFLATAYAGTVNLTFTADLRPAVPAYVLKFNAKGIDLAKLIQDTDAKNKDLEGILNLGFQVQGTAKGTSSLAGSGSFGIENGKLWELDLFKGLGELLLLPRYKKIIFTRASGDLLIQDDYIRSEELEFSSDQLKVKGHGKTGFNGSLDYTAYIEANKELIAESADIRKFTSAVFGELSSALSIKIGGTIQKPTYHIIPFPTEIIKKVKDFFLGK